MGLALPGFLHEHRGSTRFTTEPAMSKRPSLHSASELDNDDAPRPSWPSTPRSAPRADRDLDAGASLALAERIASAPAGAVAKGLFFQAVIDQARAASGRAPGRERYIAFKDYPFTEWLEVLVECARVTHPRLAPREALRRIGRNVYPRFAESTLGKVILGAAGTNVVAAVRLMPRIYSSVGSAGTVYVREMAPGRAVVELRGFWDFPDAYHVGVFEGGLAALGHPGTVRAQSLSPCDADLELVWR
jgi:uncharacterized protein (TIGR02265 family)